MSERTKLNDIIDKHFGAPVQTEGDDAGYEITGAELLEIAQDAFDHGVERLDEYDDYEPGPSDVKEKKPQKPTTAPAGYALTDEYRKPKAGDVVLGSDGGAWRVDGNNWECVSGDQRGRVITNYADYFASLGKRWVLVKLPPITQFEHTGEFREPVADEWYMGGGLYTHGQPFKRHDGSDLYGGGPRWILRKVIK